MSGFINAGTSELFAAIRSRPSSRCGPPHVSRVRRAAPGQRVYVIVGDAGFWELREAWVVGVWASRVEAERWMAEGTALARAITLSGEWPNQRAAVVALVERDPAHGHRSLLDMFGPDEPLLPYQLESFATTDYEVEEHQVL